VLYLLPHQTQKLVAGTTRARLVTAALHSLRDCLGSAPHDLGALIDL
jgi:hypothetical protein